VRLLCGHCGGVLKALQSDISMRRKTNCIAALCVILEIVVCHDWGVNMYCKCHNLVQPKEVDVIFSVLPVGCISRRLSEAILKACAL